MFVTLLLIVIALNALLALLHYTTNHRNYWTNRNVPSREPCPLFGNFGSTFTMKRSWQQMFSYLYDKYKDERYVGIFQARRPALMLIDVNLVKTILSTEFSKFGDRVMVTTDTNREPLLRNLATMSGSEWKSMRRIVTNTFSSAKMKAMFSLVAECAHTLDSVLTEMSSTEVDVLNVMTRFTTDVIGSCAFGVDPCSLKDSNSPFLRMSSKMFKVNRSVVLKRYCRSFFPRLYKFLNLKSYTPEIEHFFTSIISQVLVERREKGVQRNDFIQLMLNVQETEQEFQMTDQLITSNSFIFMLAGLETSAITLSFCLYELAHKPELQEILRSEIRQCYEKDGGLTYDAVSNMKLLHQTIQETLRLHPPTPMITRMCTGRYEVPDSQLVLYPKETVIVPIWCIQRDERNFPDPDKFDINRFSETLHPPGFIPFGDGPRTCPGARLGQMMTMSALAVILNKFTVERCSKTSQKIVYDPRSVLLKNKGGIWLAFHLNK